MKNDRSNNSDAELSQAESALRREVFLQSIDKTNASKNNEAMGKGLVSEQFADGQVVVPAFKLRDYFNQKVILEVPKWQREYTWDPTSEGQVGVLLDDLKSFVEDNSQEEYLLGAVIVCNSENPNSVLLIDGQQRTVTLSLLLMACEEFLSHSNFYTQDKYFFKTTINNMVNTETDNRSFKPRVVWAQENANKILVKIYDWMIAQGEDRDDYLDESEKLSKTQSNLLSAVKFIRHEIREGKWIPHDKLIEGLEKIFNGVRIIQLRLGDEKEAQRAFDRINHRGMQLSDADLIKNLIFQNVDDNDFEILSDSWVNMTDILRDIKSSKLSDPKYLLRAHAWTYWERKHGYDDLADLYKKSDFISPNNAKAFSIELEKYALALKGYSKELKHEKFGELPLLMPPNFLGSVQHYPVLLAGYGISNKESFEHLYKMVSLRSLQYVLAKERPPEFESMIPKWANAIREAGRDVTIEKLNEIYNSKAFGENSAAKREFLNDSLDSQMRSWSYSEAAGKKKIRATLALLSWWVDSLNDTHYSISEYFSTKKPRGQRGAKGWDLDHICATKYEDPKISAEIRNTIGNLTLLGPEDNREASNVSPISKAVLYRNSHLVFTKTIVGEELTPRMERGLAKVYEACEYKPTWNLKTWSEDDINSRTEFLISFTKKILNLELSL